MKSSLRGPADFVVLCFVVFILVVRAAGARNEKTQWSEGTFESIKTGATTLAEVQRVYGPGKRDEAAHQRKDLMVDWYYYSFPSGPFAGYGAVEVSKSSGVVRRVLLWGDSVQSLKATDIIRLFGDQYVIVRYAAEPCSNEDDSVDLYEDPKGVFMFYEYRQKGVAIAVDPVTRGANNIVFGSLPLGAMASRCGDAGLPGPDR